jgi:predicted GIY-YIG superfamily endonuclease
MRTREYICTLVREAFLDTHQGYSSDEVIICDKLNKPFIAACKKRSPSLTEQECNWRLMSMRKQGKLGQVASKRERVNHDDYLHASEIAARLIYDKHQVSVDRALCHPAYRKEFDTIAKSVAPDIWRYLLRKAALKLRKNRQLKPELVPRIASWGREILVLAVEQVIRNPSSVPRKPGVYVFRDGSGYLYIGESVDLHLRIRKHLDHSDCKSLARYFWGRGVKDTTIELHVFDPSSDARRKNHRRAYEASLIHSRRPQFNIQV